MKIAHFADTHLGYRSGAQLDSESKRNRRSVDIERAFVATIDSILDHRPDLILHAGDVFHQVKPPWGAIRLFIEQMRRLDDIPTVVIAGNHETSRLASTDSVFSVLQSALPKVNFVYQKPDMIFTEHAVVHAVPHGTTCDPIILDGTINILLSHGMARGVIGRAAPEIGEEEIPDAVIDAGFDYIALGHYHVFHHTATSAWYSGSTERIGFGDEDVTPGFALGCLDLDRNPVVTHVATACRPMVTLASVDGEGIDPDRLASVALDLIAEQDQDALIRVDLQNVDRFTWRRVKELVDRGTKATVFFKEYVRPGRVGVADPSTSTPSGKIDIPSLFREFVAQRAHSYPPGFRADEFLSRGLEALAVATEKAEQEDGPG